VSSLGKGDASQASCILTSAAVKGMHYHDIQAPHLGSTHSKLLMVYSLSKSQCVLFPPALTVNRGHPVCD
jgi:hypothetical protein